MVFSELIALYLFFGGTAAGCFAVLSAIDLHAAFAHTRASCRFLPPSGRVARRVEALSWERVSKTVHAAAFCLLVIGMLCLLADLGKPEAFYLVFLYPTPSFMSIGAFSLMLLAACMAIALAHAVLTLGPAWGRVALVAKAVGIVVSFVVMAYTGLLLETVVAVRLWQSPWLPVLFVFSALSCGCATVLLSVYLCEEARGVREKVSRMCAADAGLIAFEAFSTIAFAITVNASSSIRPFDAFATGEGAWAFWLGFVGCGMLIPLGIELHALLSRRESKGAVALTAVFVLAGGFALRFSLVSAGVQTAV